MTELSTSAISGCQFTLKELVQLTDDWLRCMLPRLPPSEILGNEGEPNNGICEYSRDRPCPLYDSRSGGSYENMQTRNVNILVQFK